MGHKADISFFDRKRTWSKRKDVILEYYLEAYLPKVRKLGHPVLLVDGFAGAGKFGDGEPGSPAIMCGKAEAVNAKPGPRVRVLCIEPERTLFERLCQNVPSAECRNGRFRDYVDEIRHLAEKETLFLYIDPYTPSEIDWAAIDGVSQQIQLAGRSVELLMNFNTPAFVRWALSALKLESPPQADEIADTAAIDAAAEAPDDVRLSRVVGGDWWRDIVGARRGFPQLVSDVAQRVEASLRQCYSEVCWVGIKAHRADAVPKYHMFFGSRHPDALELMNDAMVRARGVSDFQIDLFAPDDVDEMLVELARDWVRRGDLILRVIRRAFCHYYWKDIRGRVESLLKDGRLVSETGRARINDTVRVKRT